MKPSATSVLLAVLCAGCEDPQRVSPPPQSYSAPAPAGALTLNFGDQGPAAAAEMATLYQHICLQAFPSDDAAQAVLQPLGAMPLEPSRVADLLHADPGQGWQLSTPVAHYAVTIEAPPFHTCAIRRMTRFGLPTAQPYIAALRDYAAGHGLVMARPAIQHSQTKSGADEQLIGTPLFTPGNRLPSETSIYVSTNTHGHFNPTVTPEAAGGVGVEIRMAHQILPPRPDPRNGT
jgi:hypothetical protein